MNEDAFNDERKTNESNSTKFKITDKEIDKCLRVATKCSSLLIVKTIYRSMKSGQINENNNNNNSNNTEYYKRIFVVFIHCKYSDMFYSFIFDLNMAVYHHIYNTTH